MFLEHAPKNMAGTSGEALVEMEMPVAEQSVAVVPDNEDVLDDGVEETSFNDDTGVIAPEKQLCALLKTVDAQRPDSIQGIRVYYYDQMHKMKYKEFNQTNVRSEITGEDLRNDVVKMLKIKPVAAHLFRLQYLDLQNILPLGKTLHLCNRGQEFILRMVCQMPSVGELVQLDDYEAVCYYFMQSIDDFVCERSSKSMLRGDREDADVVNFLSISVFALVAHGLSHSPTLTADGVCTRYNPKDFAPKTFVKKFFRVAELQWLKFFITPLSKHLASKQIKKKVRCLYTKNQKVNDAFKQLQSQCSNEEKDKVTNVLKQEAYHYKISALRDCEKWASTYETCRLKIDKNQHILIEHPTTTKPALLRVSGQLRN